MNVYTIGEDIDQAWDWVEPFIQRAFERNVDGVTTADALDDIKSGRSLVLVIEDQGSPINVALLDICPDALHLHTIAGERMRDWFPLMDQTINFICKGLKLGYQTSVSRPGMVKPMQAIGFKVHSYYMVRAVT